MNVLSQELIDEYLWTWNVSVTEDPDSWLVVSEKLGCKLQDSICLYLWKFSYCECFNLTDFHDIQNVCQTEDSGDIINFLEFVRCKIQDDWPFVFISVINIQLQWMIQLEKHSMDL